jgi:chromosome segregation ATPase
VGLNGAKPQVFVELENKIADNGIKMEVAKHVLMEEINRSNERIQQLKANFDDCSQQIDTLDRLQNLTNNQLSQTQDQLQKLDIRISKEIGDAQAELINLRAITDSSIEKFGLKVNTMEDKVKNFELNLKEQSRFLQKTFEQATTNASDISKLFMSKVEVADYISNRQQVSEQVQTIRYATYDNFRCLLATDNYLEKYLPFQMQSVASASILSFLPRHKVV